MFKFVISFCLFLFLLFGSCSFFVSDYKRPEMKRHDRELYIVDHGWDLKWTIKKAFVNGQIVSGMPYHLVEYIYGEPSLTIECPRQSLLCDRIYQYAANEHIVGSISVKADTVVKATGQLSQPCRF